MGTESENQNISEIKDGFKKTNNEMFLIIQRYEELTNQLLDKLEKMTNRAVQAEYQNRLVETVLSGGIILNEMEYHKLIGGDKNVVN